MTLDILLIRASVSRAEQRRWFSSAALALNTMLVADPGDHGTITRCYLDRLRLVMPQLSVVLQANASNASTKADVPTWVKKSEQKNYLKHHAARADLLGNK